MYLCSGYSELSLEFLFLWVTNAPLCRPLYLNISTSSQLLIGLLTHVFNNNMFLEWGLFIYLSKNFFSVTSGYKNFKRRTTFLIKMQITHLSVCYLLYSSYLDPKKKNSITSDITNNINEITLIIVIVSQCG